MAGRHNDPTCSSESVTVKGKWKGKKKRVSSSEPTKKRGRPLPDLNYPPPPDSDTSADEPAYENKGKRKRVSSEVTKKRGRPLLDLNEPALPDLNYPLPPDSSVEEPAHENELIPRLADDGCKGKWKGKKRVSSSEPTKNRRGPLPDLNQPALPDLNKPPLFDSSDDEPAHENELIPRVPEKGCTAAASSSKKREIREEEGDQSDHGSNSIDYVD